MSCKIIQLFEKTVTLQCSEFQAKKEKEDRKKTTVSLQISGTHAASQNILKN